MYTPALPGKEVAYSTERVSDVARVLARMGKAIAIRCYGDPVDWAYSGANEVIRNFAYWAATSIFQPPVGENDSQKTQEIFDSYQDWKATHEYMELADRNTIYMHCLPADRNWQVEDEVIDNTDP